nr:MMPL family transporter [Micromonospora sp. DSM 115978]
MLIAFGSVVLTGLPIVVGLFGAGTGIAVLGLTGNLIEMPSFASAGAAMIAIGVGIDYALLVVTRYREALLAGQEPEQGVVTALTTAGRSVLFAGVTVVIGVLGLVFMGLGLISGVAVGISAAVLMTMLASVTLLPALLGFVGTGVDKLGLPHRKRAHDNPDTLARRWSRTVQRRPVLYGGGALALLVVLAIPAFDLRLGFGDAGNLPEQATARNAYDLLSDGFGPGFNGPLMIAAEVGNDAGTTAVEALPAAISATDGVAFASPAQFNEAGDVAVIQVVPETSPQDEATANLVHTLRDDVLPTAFDG